MLTHPARLSINLWNHTPQNADTLVDRIHEVAPLAEVEAVNSPFGQKNLLVALESGDAQLVTDLLADELETSVYSYRWYKPALDRA